LYDTTIIFAVLVLALHRSETVLMEDFVSSYEVLS